MSLFSATANHSGTEESLLGDGGLEHHSSPVLGQNPGAAPTGFLGLINGGGGVTAGVLPLSQSKEPDNHMPVSDNHPPPVKDAWLTPDIAVSLFNLFASSSCIMYCILGVVDVCHFCTCMWI